MSNMADSRALTYTEMRELNMFTDAVVKSTIGREWNIHKVVMSRVGRFFSNAFTFPTFSGTLDLGVSDEIVQVIIDLAYGGKCGVNEENVLEVLSAAIMYQIEKLIQICVTFVLDNTISTENVLDLNVFVRDHKIALETFTDGALIETVDKFIRRNFIDLYEKDEAYKMSIEELEAFMKEDDLNMAEQELLDFVLKYITLHSLNNEKAKQLLVNVRIALIDPTKLQQIADDNETFRIEMDSRDIANASSLPRYPRDIVLVIDKDEYEIEIFNARKNEWKQGQFLGIDPNVIVGNILYHFAFFSDGSTRIESLDVKNGQLMTDKHSQLPNVMDDFEIAELLSWNGGILAFMGFRDGLYHDLVYYNPEENSWKPFPSTKGYISFVVNGHLFSIGEVEDEENGLGQVIEYFDNDTMTWILCGHLKGNSSADIDVSVVDGKVYVFPWSKTYGECFQPVWGDRRMNLVWFPNIELPFHYGEGTFATVVDNKILFTEDDKQWGLRETNLFCPRTGECTRLADLHGRRISNVFTINTSEFDEARIEQICNGEFVLSDGQP